MKIKRSVSILMVEDIGLITEAYSRIINALSSDKRILKQIIKDNCDSGWDAASNHKFDLVILDINFPHNPTAKISSGEELGKKIREFYPATKIIVLTGVIDRIQLKKIIKNINPEGFLSKGETNSREIAACLLAVLNNKRFFGEYYTRLLNSKIVSYDKQDSLKKK